MAIILPIFKQPRQLKDLNIKLTIVVNTTFSINTGIVFMYQSAIYVTPILSINTQPAFIRIETHFSEREIKCSMKLFE